jgi:hypothetical protein
MERVAETAELLGVEASIGSSKLEIGHATKDFIAGTSTISFLDMFEAGFMPMAVGEPCSFCYQGSSGLAQLRWHCCSLIPSN